MYLWQCLMHILGLSYRQLRERFAALAEADGLLDDQVGKGRVGGLQYTPAVLEILREMDELAGNYKLSLGQAAVEVASRSTGGRFAGPSHGLLCTDGERRSSHRLRRLT